MNETWSKMNDALFIHTSSKYYVARSGLGGLWRAFDSDGNVLTVYGFLSAEEAMTEAQHRLSGWKSMGQWMLGHDKGTIVKLADGSWLPIQSTKFQSFDCIEDAKRVVEGY